MTIDLSACLMLGSFLFACGIACLLTRRNAIGLLLGVELILNAANVNFVAAARFVPGFALEGQVFTVVVIVLAAAEAALALAIFLQLYNSHGSVNVDDAQALKG